MAATRYDYDIVVIGGGAAGLTCSTGAGQLGAKTLLIEKERKLGGDCLHYGCVPSKTLIKSAYVYTVIRSAEKYGLPKQDPGPVDFGAVRNRIRTVIGAIQEHDSPERIKKNYNVETRFGSPAFLDASTILLDGEKISSKTFIIATGSSPVVPPIEGIADVGYITNMDIFSLDTLPSSMIVLGGGPIGLEMAQAFQRLGSAVTVIEFLPQLLAQEDEDIAEFIRKRLEAEGIKILLGAKALKAEKEGTRITVTVDQGGVKKTVSAEAFLVATGRKPNLEGLDLEKAGVEYTKKGIRVDKQLHTSAKNIFACGDVNGGLQFTHVASYEGGVAMVNAIMRLPAKADYSKIPWCTYLDPEVASIGYNERRAREEGIPYTVQKEEFKNNDRALAEGETDGFLKLLINKKGEAIGVQIVGYHAGDLIHEWVAALNGKVSLSTMARSVHAYPNLSEISKTASGDVLAPKLFNNRVRNILKVLFHLQG